MLYISYYKLMFLLIYDDDDVFGYKKHCSNYRCKEELCSMSKRDKACFVTVAKQPGLQFLKNQPKIYEFLK